MTTLFHEFGHCLHHLLTDQTEVAVSGISGVEWDAVELPSQFMENFAWEWDVVKGLAKHVETGESIPESLFEKMLAAKNFQSGMACVRQVEFALFDMLLHTSFNPDTDDVQDLLQDVRRKVAVSFPPNYNRFRREILGRGSSRDAMENFIAFRGRRPEIDALLRHSGMTVN